MYKYINNIYIFIKVVSKTNKNSANRMNKYIHKNKTRALAAEQQKIIIDTNNDIIHMRQ